MVNIQHKKHGIIFRTIMIVKPFCYVSCGFTSLFMLTICFILFFNPLFNLDIYFALVDGRYRCHKTMSHPVFVLFYGNAWVEITRKEDGAAFRCDVAPVILSVAAIHHQTDEWPFQREGASARLSGFITNSGFWSIKPRIRTNSYSLRTVYFTTNCVHLQKQR